MIVSDDGDDGDDYHDYDELAKLEKTGGPAKWNTIVLACQVWHGVVLYSFFLLLRNR